MFEARKAWPPSELKDMKPSDWLLDPDATAGQRPVTQTERSSAMPLKAGRSEVVVTFPAGDLETWSPAHPRLYWISLAALDGAGNVVDASTPVTFGYREIWVDGPNIMLNGMPVHFFGPSHMYYGSYYWTPMDLAAKHHINLTTDRTMSTWWRAYQFADHPAVLADRWGHTYSISPDREAEILDRYFYNSPGFVMWQCSGNGFVNGPHSHPMQVGDIQRPPAKDDPRYPEYAAIMENAAAVRKLDATRPIYFYRLGWGGDIRAIMAYLDINEPVMDVMDWPLEWYRNARKECIEPFMPAEMGITLALYGMHYWNVPAQYMAGRLGHVEHAARIFGSEAYGMIRPEEITPDVYENVGLMRRNCPDSEIVTKMYVHLYNRVFPAWRAMGMSFLLHIDGKPSEQFADIGAARRRVRQPVHSTGRDRLAGRPRAAVPARRNQPLRLRPSRHTPGRPDDRPLLEEDRTGKGGRQRPRRSGDRGPGAEAGLRDGRGSFIRDRAPAGCRFYRAGCQGGRGGQGGCRVPGPRGAGGVGLGATQANRADYI
jgi:hypothetical protein